MKSGLFCHIHALQYCGNRLLLGQSLLSIVLWGKAQLGVEQTLLLECADEIKGGESECFFGLQQSGRQLKASQIFRKAPARIGCHDCLLDLRISHRKADVRCQCLKARK